jgi:predicted nucleic acid-binding protein
VHLVTLDEPLLDRAGGLDPPELRSLDAVHLAAALALGPDLGIMFVYDVRLRQAAEACGLPVGAPI